MADTRVVMTTVGPFEQYGSPVVEACAKHGTHYVDITGESDFVKTMLLQWDDTARRTGAKIVSHCGCDCIPSDLSVMQLESALPEGESLQKASLILEAQGGASGGTLATVALVAEGKSRGPPNHDFDPCLRLPGGSESDCKTEASFPMPTRKWKDGGRFEGSTLGFFVLSVPNSMTVMRSNALRGRSSRLLFEEGAWAPDWKTAFLPVLLQTVGAILLSNPITAYLIKKVLPKPGEGPSMVDMTENSFFCMTGYGYGSKGTKTETALYFPKDIGYIETARMVSESAMCLAFDDDKLPVGAETGGFFTPSTAMGDALLNRLVGTGSFFAVNSSVATTAEKTRPEEAV